MDRYSVPAPPINKGFYMTCKTVYYVSRGTCHVNLRKAVAYAFGTSSGRPERLMSPHRILYCYYSGSLLLRSGVDILFIWWGCRSRFNVLVIIYKNSQGWILSRLRRALCLIQTIKMATMPKRTPVESCPRGLTSSNALLRLGEVPFLK